MINREPKKYALEQAIKSCAYGMSPEGLIARAEKFEAYINGENKQISPLDWVEQMNKERARQIEKGYTDAHDKEKGVQHLMIVAIDCLRQGKPPIQAATVMREAGRLYAEEVGEASA